MAVKISRVITFGPGSKGFRFRNYEDAIADRKQYEAGCRLEQARFREGSLGGKIFARLSSHQPAASRMRQSIKNETK